MTTFIIHVTKEIYEKSKNCGKGDVTKGKEKGVGSNCAIALAVRELFPNVWVDHKNIQFIKDWKDLDSDSAYYGSVPLPVPAQYLISKFDDATPEDRVKLPELSFKIQVPDNLLEKVVDISSIQEILKDSKTLQLV